MTSEAPPSEPDAPQAGGSPSPPRRPSRPLAAAAVIGALLILAFSPVSRLVAGTLPSPPSAPVTVTASAGAHPTGTTAVKAVPEGLPNGARIRTLSDVRPYAVAALGARGAQTFLSRVASASPLTENAAMRSGVATYPFDYRPLDPDLNAAPHGRFAAGATALGAALTVLAAQPTGGASEASVSAIENAGPAAYAVLNRARAAGGCPPQLDLLLVVASDPSTITGYQGDVSQGILAKEQRRAQAACPGDPTPGWIVGQEELRAMQVDASSDTHVFAPDVYSLLAAQRTFRRMVAQFPHDTGVLTGLGDSYLRTGTFLAQSEPFTARGNFRAAITAYNRAAHAGAGNETAAGVGRALIGLGYPAKAARTLAPLAGSSSAPGEFLELLTYADESAKDYKDATTAAAQLARRGSEAFPDTDDLFPAPLYSGINPLDEASLPLSFGAGRLMPLQTSLVVAGGAGATPQDLSFIPQYRDDPEVTGTNPVCASWTITRDELLLGKPAAAIRDWQADPRDARSVSTGPGPCPDGTKLALLALMQEGQPPDQAMLNDAYLTRDQLHDSWQNLLRWEHRLPAARAAAARWQAADGSKGGLPALRLGEIDFLMHRYGAAASEFDQAAHRYALARYNDKADIDRAQLDQGAALMKAGQTTEALAVLRPLDLDATQSYSQESSSYEPDFDKETQYASVSYYACEQLGDYESSAGQLRAAADDYRTALSWTKDLDQETGIVPEVLNNNAALASLGLHDVTTAAALENKALVADPEDPLFLMGAGFIADRAGQAAKAIRYDREALASDPKEFPAANDLGVELVREHHPGAAVQDLRRAVGARPGYALGWFNLGVAESALGPAHLPAAQGAFAKAYTLDPALKNRQHTVTIDASVYRTALDLSKPLPAQWSLAQLPQKAPTAAGGLLAILMLAFGLARATGHGGGTLAAQWLVPLSERLTSLPVLRRLRHPAWGLAVTAASFLFAYLWRDAGATEIVAYIAGVVILSLLAVAARMLISRRERVGTVHESWQPGLPFALVTGAISLPWAPLPVVREDGAQEEPGRSQRRIHLAAPLTLMTLSAALFIEFAWLQTPLTDAWAVAALIMATSTLLPAGPLDGAKLGKEGAVAAAGIVGGALLVGLGLI